MSERTRMCAAVACLLVATSLAAAPIAAQDATDAYVDPVARELVRLARVQRGTVDRRIESYATTARERFTASLRAGVVEKLLFRRETVVRIDWQRDGEVRLELLGLREVAPVADGAPTVPYDVGAELPSLAFDPGDEDMLVRLDETEIRHPLKAGSEASYRFAAGDTTVISLPDGRRVRLLELRVIPRVRRPELFAGSLWLDAESHAVVRAQMRLARSFDADTDITIDTGDAGWLARLAARQTVGLLKPLRLSVDFLTIEYGLWDFQWWLPRLAVARGVAQVGRFEIPVEYERTYSAYEVHGDAAVDVVARSDSVSERCRPDMRFVRGDDASAADTMRQARADREAERRARAQGDDAPTQRCARTYVVAAGADSMLLHSAELARDPYGGGFELVDATELRDIVDRARAIGSAPWRVGRPVVQWGVEGAGLSRYNRVEGASPGMRVLLPAAPLQLRAEVRYGFAEQRVRGEVAVERSGGAVDVQLAAYRRLRSTSRDVHGMASSLGALLFGRDDDAYFDARGAELLLRPAAVRRPWYDLRLYAERQRAVERNTNFSVARLVDSDQAFPPNFVADAADQLGASLRLRHSIGTFPARARLDGELAFTAETGDYRFLRRDAMLRALLPLPQRFYAGVEVAAGTIDGATVPAQALWRLGGAASLRGYPTAALIGEHFRRGRAELGIRHGSAQYGIFADAATAGPLFDSGDVALRRSVGVGITQLGGLLRMDIARGLDAGGGWRLHVQVNREFEQ